MCSAISAAEESKGMTSTKSWISILATCVALSMVGCGSAGDDGGNQSATADTAPTHLTVAPTPPSAVEGASYGVPTKSSLAQSPDTTTPSSSPSIVTK